MAGERYEAAGEFTYLQNAVYFGALPTRKAIAFQVAVNLSKGRL
jgi:hypothetical protein